MMRKLFIILPVFIVTFAIFILGFLPISEAMNKAQQNRVFLISQREKLVLRLQNLSSVNSEEEALSFIWPEKSINQAALKLQSQISEIATKHNVPVLLLGPKGNTKEDKLTRFTVELETETGLRSAVGMLSDLENLRPSIGIASLDLRQISTFDPSETEVNIYMRLVVWGWISNEAN